MSRPLEPGLAQAFADALDYPRAPVGAAARTCERLAGEVSPEASELLAGFRSFAESRPLGELQEAYTRAFDLDTLSELEPTLYPYVGHHLFDENHKRSAFLVELSARYREHGFSPEGELPDHLVVILRFVAACDDEELVDELVREALVPALARMGAGAGAAAAGTSGRDRYHQALAALAVTLGAVEEASTPAAGREGSAAQC